MAALLSLIAALFAVISAMPEGRMERQTEDPCYWSLGADASGNRYTNVNFDDCDNDLVVMGNPKSDNYANNVDSTITVTSYRTGYINIYYYVDIEEDRQCKYDSITFGYGQSNAIKVCGTGFGNFSFLSRGEFTIKFLSDDSLTRRGILFTLNFTEDYPKYQLIDDSRIIVAPSSIPVAKSYSMPSVDNSFFTDSILSSPSIDNSYSSSTSDYSYSTPAYTTESATDKWSGYPSISTEEPFTTESFPSWETLFLASDYPSKNTEEPFTTESFPSWETLFPASYYPSKNTEEPFTTESFPIWETLFPASDYQSKGTEEPFTTESFPIWETTSPSPGPDGYSTPLPTNCNQLNDIVNQLMRRLVDLQSLLIEFPVSETETLEIVNWMITTLQRASSS